MGGEGDDSLKENVTGLDQLKRLRLDLSASDSDGGQNLVLPASPAQDDAGGGGGFVSPHDSPSKLKDNENLNTRGGHGNIVSGVGGIVVNNVAGQSDLDNEGGEIGVGQAEVDLQIVDKGGGHEAGGPSEIVAQDGISSDDSSESDVSNTRQQVPLSE